MSDNTLRSTILRIAGPAVEAEGLRIWGLELNTSGRMLVRLFVEGERPQAPLQEDARETNGEEEESLAAISATVNQCEAISRQLSFALDAEEVIDRAYTLEVSSPGFNRIFFGIEQMRPYVGDMVEARMPSPWSPKDTLPARRTWKGVLESVGEKSFTILPSRVDEEGEIIAENLESAEIPFGNARRVSRIHVFRMPQKPGKGSKPGKAKQTSSTKKGEKKPS